MWHCRGPGWVYAAREDDTPLVKIGTSQLRYVEDRIKGLQSQFKVPFTLISAAWIAQGARLVERALHGALASSRIWQEFFYVSMTASRFTALVEELLPGVKEGMQAEERVRQADHAKRESNPIYRAYCFAQSERISAAMARKKTQRKETP